MADGIVKDAHVRELKATLASIDINSMHNRHAQEGTGAQAEGMSTK